MKLTIHTDGGSRGNPGPAASAFVVEKDGKPFHRASTFLGNTTNNTAEYRGVITSLNWLSENNIVKKLGVDQLTFFLDSELVVKQINGLYKVKDENLRNLFYEVNKLLKSAGVKVTFEHVLRDKNKEADFLVNQELDSRI